MDGILAEAGLDAAHDGVGVGFDPVAAGSEPRRRRRVSMYRARIRRGHAFGGVCAQSEQRDSPSMAGRRPQRVQAALAASPA